MSTLHTVNKSSFTHSTLASCLAVCSESDGILLLEDGVFGGLKASPCEDHLFHIMNSGVKVYALLDDVKARGLVEKLLPQIITISYTDFVQLSIQHRCVQSWY